MDPNYCYSVCEVEGLLRDYYSCKDFVDKMIEDYNMPIMSLNDYLDLLESVEEELY